MESVSKKTGKVFTGKLATIMHRIGVANLVEPPKKVKAENPKIEIKADETKEK